MLRSLFIPVLSMLCLVGCDNAETRRVEDTRSNLVGTWQREVPSGGVKARRVLVLDAQGKFVERLVRPGPDGKDERVEYAGEWSYDGENFKRRFLQENGRQFAGGGMRFATFPLVSAAKNEFVVNDNIQAVNATYRRALEGTEP